MRYESSRQFQVLAMAFHRIHLLPRPSLDQSLHWGRFRYFQQLQHPLPRCRQSHLYLDGTLPPFASGRSWTLMVRIAATTASASTNISEISCVEGEASEEIAAPARSLTLAAERAAVEKEEADLSALVAQWKAFQAPDGTKAWGHITSDAFHSVVPEGLVSQRARCEVLRRRLATMAHTPADIAVVGVAAVVPGVMASAGDGSVSASLCPPLGAGATKLVLPRALPPPPPPPPVLIAARGEAVAGATRAELAKLRN